MIYHLHGNSYGMILYGRPKEEPKIQNLCVVFRTPLSSRGRRRTSRQKKNQYSTDTEMFTKICSVEVGNIYIYIKPTMIMSTVHIWKPLKTVWKCTGRCLCVRVSTYTYKYVQKYVYFAGNFFFYILTKFLRRQSINWITFIWRKCVVLMYYICKYIFIRIQIYYNI